MKQIAFFISALFVTALWSCTKDAPNGISNRQISFSVDTLRFDTVFTERGSVTQSVKIINSSNKRLTLDNITLAGGDQSPFKLNINGTNGSSSVNEILRAEDSLYVFVQVFIDPNNQKQPFILKDSIAVKYNGQTQWLQLQAYGQNAHYLKNKEISADTAWTNDLPIVIDGSVDVLPGVRLRLEAGTRILMHATAPFIVEGSLEAVGTVESPVIFDGDRMDADYRDLPASWPGIYFAPSSKQNTLQSVHIQNAYQGIIADQDIGGTSPKITISRSVIKNIYDAGIQALNSSFLIENSLIVNCGKNIELLLGGDYSMINCTVASYDNRYFGHSNPVLTLTDYFENDEEVVLADLVAKFTNCIFWGQEGSVKNEISADKKGSGVFDVVVNNSIYRAEEEVPNIIFNQNYLNEDPLFDIVDSRRNIFDFHLSTQSPALNSGRATPYNTDLDGKTRGSTPDVGCYELD